MLTQSYRALTQIAYRLPRIQGKIAESLAGRERATARWAAWAARERTKTPCLWVHAASVGEWLAAVPVVERLRQRVDDLQVVHTFTSPSVERWSVVHADMSDYLPPDEPSAMQALFDGLDPTHLLLSRGDLWPECVAEAHRRGVPVSVIGGSIRPSSRRIREPWRTALRRVGSMISWVGAVSVEDAERWHSLGIAKSDIDVTGDPRHTQVIERTTRLDAIRPLRAWSGHRVLIAGSTDERDHELLLEALVRVRSTHPDAKTIIAPHDVHEGSLRTIWRRGASLGLEITRWPSHELSPGAAAVIVESLGVLADLYAFGSAAYVGGGFKNRSLHAVIEPAAFGLPVMFGPRCQDSRDAKMLLSARGGFALPHRQPVEHLTAVWNRLLADQRLRHQAGLAARGTLESGAADETVARLSLR